MARMAQMGAFRADGNREYWFAYPCTGVVKNGQRKGGKGMIAQRGHEPRPRKVRLSLGRLLRGSGEGAAKKLKKEIAFR